MRRISFSDPVAWVFVFMFAAALPGCAGTQRTGGLDATAEGDLARRGEAMGGRAGAIEPGVGHVRTASEAHAKRLTEALTQKPLSEPGSPLVGPHVRWLRNPGPSVAQAAGPKPNRPDKPLAVRRMETPPPVESNRDPKQPSFAHQWSEKEVPLTRTALLAQLRQAVRSGRASVINKAIAAAGLSLADPDRVLDPVDLEPLDRNQRQLVRRYHKLLVSLAGQMESGGGQLDTDTDTVMDRVGAVWGERPVRVTRVQLCRRVRGYGVYEPFDSRVFLSGREHPMIIYTELKNFRTIKTDEDFYQVKLQQEVVLYNESDGLAVWRQPAVDIVDESRNRRRDFFVVQMIRLPARLGVGKYVLKVRMTDAHSGSLDESTVLIQLVADQSLVAGGLRSP